MAYGKKNHVKLDPLAYNIGLLGESKIGKTTLIFKVCQKLAGEDGYIFAEIGQERGADAIEGINHVNCPEWNMPFDEDTNSLGFADLIDDIVDNKSTEYKNLRVLVIDTYDQLITIAEHKSIALWNAMNQDKKVSSINAAWGGFGRGEKKAIELMLDAIARLRSVGVATIVIGHLKTKDNTDVVTGETYQTLTSDQQQNYFNALKKNLHVLGIAYIDRSIVKEKTDKKDPVTKKDKYVGKIVSESRKIKFRDDTYCVDCGGRFAEITPEIDLDADQFIEAINNAILAEQAKSTQSLEDAKKEQKAAEEKLEKKVAETEKINKEQKEIENGIQKIKEFCNTHLKDPIFKDIMSTCKTHGYANPTLITDLETIREILKLIKA